jgi:hypothetical protein
VLTARIHEVCRECNNGWISRLETAARSVHNHLWRPSYTFRRARFLCGRRRDVGDLGNEDSLGSGACLGPNRRGIDGVSAPPEN